MKCGSCGYCELDRTNPTKDICTHPDFPVSPTMGRRVMAETEPDAITCPKKFHLKITNIKCVDLAAKARGEK